MALEVVQVKPREWRVSRTSESEYTNHPGTLAVEVVRLIEPLARILEWPAGYFSVERLIQREVPHDWVSDAATYREYATFDEAILSLLGAL